MKTEQPNVELIAEDEVFKVCTVNKYYLVSNYGRIYSLKRKTIKKPYNAIYLTVTLYNPDTKKQKTYRIHRLVALAWIPNPMGYRDVNHKNELDKHDNRVMMLEWCSPTYNNNYGTKNERCSIAQSKAVYQYNLDFTFVKVWRSQTEIGKTTNYCDKTIGYHCRHKNPYDGYYWLFESVNT